MEDLDQVIFSNKAGKDKGHESFWSEISESVLPAALPWVFTDPT